MAELLFIATVVFVAYVVFVVLGKKNEIPEPSKAETTPPRVEEPAKPEPENNAPTLEKAPATSKPTRPKTTAGKASSAKAPLPPVTESAPEIVAAAPKSTVGDTLKNPKTGEVAKVPASYAFAKRWIKDALVEEGLLDKVYKNNELDDAVNGKIHAAIQQLRAMDKYQ